MRYRLTPIAPSTKPAKATYTGIHTWSWKCAVVRLLKSETAMSLGAGTIGRGTPVRWTATSHPPSTTTAAGTLRRPVWRAIGAGAYIAGRLRAAQYRDAETQALSPSRPSSP